MLRVCNCGELPHYKRIDEDTDTPKCMIVCHCGKQTKVHVHRSDASLEWNMFVNPDPDALAKIPQGPYCYHGWVETPNIDVNGVSHGKVKACPFWGMDERKPRQMNGYCTYLGYGDWERKGSGLLWDACKECGINDGDELYANDNNVS